MSLPSPCESQWFAPSSCLFTRALAVDLGRGVIVDLRLSCSLSRSVWRGLKKRGSVKEVASPPPLQAPQGKHGAALSRFCFQALNYSGNKGASPECCHWKHLASLPVAVLISWGSRWTWWAFGVGGGGGTAQSKPLRRLWWVVFMRVCVLLPSLGWYTETAGQKARAWKRRRCSLVWRWGRNVLPARVPSGHWLGGVAESAIVSIASH